MTVLLVAAQSSLALADAATQTLEIRARNVRGACVMESRLSNAAYRSPMLEVLFSYPSTLDPDHDHASFSFQFPATPPHTRSAWITDHTGGHACGEVVVDRVTAPAGTRPIAAEASTRSKCWEHGGRSFGHSRSMSDDCAADGQEPDMLTGVGWELHLVRLGQQRGPALIRTYGRYEVFVDSALVPSLTGFMCESQGPGENERHCDERFRRRIRAGTYPLYTHDTKYTSVAYSGTATRPTPEKPMPAFGLADTGIRTGILVHPAHDGGLYLASVGCLNPTHALGADDDMDIDDSRSRVVALLTSLSGFGPAAFAHRGERPITGASIVIEGESDN